ncbi:hypothetical protein CABS03_09812 [Colletotrichum abscissum]|uniref:Uncharacterized protein n=2 Tax=Colletotrichum acutatum species complex TaxID=2707335 RepID=A0A9P9X4F4_9PEZI|nr:hypothetical protein CABS02_13074 [Colletotrichum abscissum]KAK0374511.1 hypothetical protein CLIM01_08144 [Colletotrichum limetticola]
MRTRQKTLYDVCPGLPVRPCYANSANALICPRTSPSDTGSWIEDTRLERLVSTTRP